MLLGVTLHLLGMCSSAFHIYVRHVFEFIMLGSHSSSLHLTVIRFRQRRFLRR